MNILHMLWVFLTFVVFIIALRTYTAVNLSERNRFFNIYLQAFVLVGFLFFIFGGMLSLPLFLVYFFVAFSTVVPMIVGRLIKLNQVKFKQPLMQLSESSPVVLFWNITITLLLIMYFLISVKRVIFTSAPPYDKDYYFDQAGIMMLAGSYLILQLMNLFQKVTFYAEGLFYYGILWEWSDFQNYSWKNSTTRDKHQELLLKTSNDAWFIKQIKLALPIVSKERVNMLMGEKINKNSESL